MKKEYGIFLELLLLFLALQESYGCFSENKQFTLKKPTGSSFYLECQCTDPKYSVNNLRWLGIDDKEIAATRPDYNTKVYTEKFDRGISLHIRSISKTLSGPYKCETKIDGKSYTHTYVVEAYDELYFHNTDPIQYMIKDRESLIKCSARGSSVPFISWYKENDESSEIIQNDEKYNITPNGLIIKNVTDDDSGTYKCTAVVFETSEEVETKIKVEVLTLPAVEEFKVTPDKTAVEGSYVTVECLATGVPTPEFTWLKASNVRPIEVFNSTWHQEGNTLLFESIQADDRGNYECIANNTAGNSRADIFIEVLVPPNITSFDNFNTSEGSTAQIVCMAQGRPQPDINIYFEEPLDENLGISRLFQKISETEVAYYINFEKVNRSFDGIYTCNASNEVAFIAEAIHMSVLHKPYFEEPVELVWGWIGHTVNLSCEHQSNPLSTIQWSYDGTETEEVNELVDQLNNLTEHSLLKTINNDSYFGLYVCEAKNEIGESKKIISLIKGHVPPPIRNVSIFDWSIKAKSVIFDIVGPESVQGPEVIGFTAQYDELENFSTTSIHINRTWSIVRPYKLDKLKPNTTYLIKFAAQNAVGVGSWGGYLQFQTLEKSIPDSPDWQLNSDTSTIGRSTTLKWNAPDDNGDPIDYYVVRYCPKIEELIEEKTCKKEKLNPTTELELSNLEYNTTYYLELWAHNSVGDSIAATRVIYVNPQEEPRSSLAAGTIIGLSIAVVILCVILLDLLLLFWKRQGMIANCYYGKKKKQKQQNIQSRDKKGLLKDTGEVTSEDKTNNGHKEFEYNKTTGVITGKHSAV